MSTEIANTGADAHESASRRLRDEIQSQLAMSPYPALRGVRCDCEPGAITLQGQVPSYYAVQIALSLVRSRVRGQDVVIRNHLRVAWDAELRTGDQR